MRFWTPKKVHGKPLAGIAVACYPADAREYSALLGLVAAVQAQTYDRWRLLLVHDGPPARDTAAPRQAFRAAVAADDRVQWFEPPERAGKFGHPHRQAAIDLLLAQGCTHVGLTNQDNYYAPTYLEWLLSVATNPKKPRELVYCNCVHSHKLWQPMTTEPRRGRIDLGCFLAAAGLVRQVRFDNFAFNGDGVYIERLRNRARGVEKVNATLMVHN